MALNQKALAVAGAALAGAWLLERLNESKPSTDIQPTRNAAMDPTLGELARVMPCDLERFANLKTLTGAEVRKLPSGAGEDFLREFFIQRMSLVKSQGDLALFGGQGTDGILGALLPGRPALSALCAKQWLEMWLNAWQAAARASGAYAVAERVTIGGGRSPYGNAACSTTDWRAAWSMPTTLTGSTFGATDSCRMTSLGKAWLRLRELHLAAEAATAPAIPESVQTAKPWILARHTSEALQDFAREMDNASFSHGDAYAEALDTLRKDLAPVNFLRKAADWAVTPAEVALDNVVGPALSSFLGTVVVAVLPYAALGAAIYVVAKRSM